MSSGGGGSDSPPGQKSADATDAHEIVFFLPRVDSQVPLTAARELVEALGIGRAAVGEDLLSGGVILRLHYSAQTLTEARRYLDAQAIRYEVELW